MGHKVPQSQYFHGLWHSFFFSTVKDGIISKKKKCQHFFSFFCHNMTHKFSLDLIFSLRKNPAGFLPIHGSFPARFLYALCRKERHLFYRLLILSTAFAVFSYVPNAVSRKYPSPLGPNPDPGVPTTPAFSSR